MAGEYIRDTQVAVEVIRSGTTSLLIRNTQTATEVMRVGAPVFRNTQTAVEVLRKYIPEVSEQPRISIVV